MQAEERKTHLHLLGLVTISSLNQIGERVKYDKKKNAFVLAKAGSSFELCAHLAPGSELGDFRKLETIEVSLKVDGLYLAINKENHQATLVDCDQHGTVPPNAVFHYQRKRFDRFSASLSFREGSNELWMRHSNSKLRFDLEGTGASFLQDASFLFRPHDRQFNFATPTPTASKSVGRGKRSLENNMASETDTGLTKFSPGYMENIENRIDNIMRMIHMNDANINEQKKIREFSPA